MLWRMFQGQARWGIFDASGNPMGNPSQFMDIPPVVLSTIGLGPTLSTNAVDYTKEMRISDFPIERGGFASYNKVELPASPVVTLCFGGSDGDRSAFLDALDVATKSIDLYSVATPDATYIDYSIERYNYSRRSSKGATMLIVEVALREIRQVSAQYTQVAKDTSAAPVQDNGKVQPQKPDVSTLKSIANKLGL
jgi:hypothetical protein